MHRRQEEERAAACLLLGLPPHPTRTELRQAYRALALLHHPDKLPPDASDAQRQEGAAKFNEVQEAHETLLRVFGWAKGARLDSAGSPGDDDDGDDRGAPDEETPGDEGGYGFQ